MCDVSVSMPCFNIDDSEWALKMQPDICSSIHMVTFEQTLQKIGVISADGGKSKIDWDVPLNCLLIYFNDITLSSQPRLYPVPAI